MSEHERTKAQRNNLARSWSAFMAGEDPSPVRADVLASWRRTAPFLSPELAAAPLAPIEVDHGPLLKVVRSLEREFKATMLDSGVVLALTDPHGQVVGTTGDPKLLKLAGQANFAPGAVWNETAMGLNAISLVLTSGRPAAVWATEHWSHSLHSWSCYAAPLLHPQTGRRLGVLNLSTPWDKDQPLAAAVIVGLAGRLSAEIGANVGVSLYPDSEGLDMRVLGPHQVALDGAPLSLSRRQTEISLLLALQPGGTGLEELHADLYGDAGVAVDTLKAEVSHLRRALGGRISRAPYRIACRVDVDALELLADLREGRTRDATRRFGGPLLPWSDSPRIVRLARTVEVSLRDAVLAGTDMETALLLAGRFEEDAELVEHILRILPPGDARRHIMNGRLAAIA